MAPNESKTTANAPAPGSEGLALQARLVSLLREKKLTVATAESCTGGLVGAMITEVPSSSDVYLGGWVVYSNAMKAGQLGVDQALIQQHGAVSQAVAHALAQAAAQRSGANLAISITGIAGPDGGTPDKPVGTVWFGLTTRDPNHPQTPTTQTHLQTFAGDRQRVRQSAASHALQTLHQAALDA